MTFNLCEEFDNLNLRLVANIEVVAVEIDSTLSQDIQKGQLTDEKIQEIKWNIKEGKSPDFTEDDQGVLLYKGRICVPNVKEIKNLILREAHDSTYSMKSRTSYFEKLMILLTLFIQEAIRCIKISRFPTGGMELNMKL
jgi:hypothetical protein